MGESMSQLPGVSFTCLTILCYAAGDVCVQGLDKLIPVFQLNIARLTGQSIWSLFMYKIVTLDFSMGFNIVAPFMVCATYESS